MDMIYFYRLFAAFGILTNIIFVIWIVYRKTRQYDPNRFIYLTISSLCALSFSIHGVIRPYTWITNVIENSSLFVSIVFLYFAFNKIYETFEDPKNVWTTNLMKISISSLVIVSTINYFQQDNILDFGDDNLFYASWKFAFSNIIFYISLGWLCFNIFILCKKSLKQKWQLFDLTIRKILGLAGSGSGIVVSSVMIINVLLICMGNITHTPHLNKMYQWSRFLALIFITLSIGMPSILLLPITYPMHQIYQRRKLEEVELIKDLHSTMITIVPKAHFKMLDISNIRLQIEIGDARQIILSHYAEGKSLSARNEAELLYKLLVNGVVLKNPGKYKPVLPKGDIKRHNLSVALHLQKMLSDLS